ncbi:MAG TPA: dTDP-4-dehydrorhamnose reductase [Acidimicrobiales bacterium]|nr:dTDP-4-dehydrorhamnose reductase [Acidimicrobiales bacterium]
MGAVTRVLVTGAGGQLGRDLVEDFAANGGGKAHEVVAADRARLDVTDRDAVLQAMGAFRPDVVVHAAAWTAVDACEADPDRAMAVNALGTRHVAEGARLVGAHVCYLSTDYVFDGRASRPYTEWDEPNPLSVYGRTKLAGERELAPRHAVVRTSWVCGHHGSNIVHTVLRLAAEGGTLRFVDDQIGCPTFTFDLAPAVRSLALSRRPGVYHVTNQGPTTWFGFARAIVAAAGHDADRVEAVRTEDLRPPRPAPRPANSVLDNAAMRLSGLPLLPAWQDSLERLVKELTA